MAEGLFLFGSNQTAEVPSTPGNANDATPKAPLGSLYRANGKVYRYVLFDNGSDNVAAVAGGVVHWKTLAPPTPTFTVTSDYSSAKGKNLCAGVLGCVVTDGYYTWIQVGGIADCTGLDFSGISGDVVAGYVKGCKASYSTTDLAFKLTPASTDPTAVVYGVVVEATSYTLGTGKILLQNLDW